MTTPIVRLAAGIAVICLSAMPADIPIEPGVTFVLAVNDATPAVGKGEGVVQGGYEMVVAIDDVTAEGVSQSVFIEGVDAAGVRRQGSIRRMVSAVDIAHSHVQVLGFHSYDPLMVSGTTSLGPSLTVTRDLVQSGEAAYSFLDFVTSGLVSGRLRRSSASPVKFPVLLNGTRVELDAIHATGEMSLGGVRRPFETVILDHPRYPLSLRIAYGPRDGTFPFVPAFTREIVRIDVPTATASPRTGPRATVRGPAFPRPAPSAR